MGGDPSQAPLEGEVAAWPSAEGPEQLFMLGYRAVASAFCFLAGVGEVTLAF